MTIEKFIVMFASRRVLLSGCGRFGRSSYVLMHRNEDCRSSELERGGTGKGFMACRFNIDAKISKTASDFLRGWARLSEPRLLVIDFQNAKACTHRPSSSKSTSYAPETASKASSETKCPDTTANTAMSTSRTIPCRCAKLTTVVAITSATS